MIWNLACLSSALSGNIACTLQTDPQSIQGKRSLNF